MSETLDFSTLEIQEVPVIAPDGKNYVLREANGKAATEHRNAVMASVQLGPDGKAIGVKDLASIESKFVAACLWDDRGRNPSSQLVQTWPARVQKQLYDKAKELSDMNDASPLQKALAKAVAREDSPVSLEQLSTWIESLSDDKELQPLVRLVQDAAKGRDDSKNS